MVHLRLRFPAADLADWGSVIAGLGLQGMAQQLALNCSFGGREGDAVTLLLDPAHAHLRIPTAEDRLREALSRHFGAALRLNIEVGAGHAAVRGTGEETPAQQAARVRAERQRAAEQAIFEDPYVQAFQEVLGARVQRDAIQPLDEPTAAQSNTLH